MPDDLGYLWIPWLACLVLTGIHAYLGIHVIERGVIFVDLALAQIAALGATIALLTGGFPIGSNGAWFFSLGFTLIGAAVFALTRMRHGRIPQEAIIGIVYAVTSAAAIVVIWEARDPHGAEHIRDLLAGNILYVGPARILKTAALYAAIGAFHFIFRGKLIRISLDPDGAARDGVNLVLWDFLFYATFGFVITSSVQIAGVLLVFSFLVVPAVFAMLFAEGFRARLLIGWSVGALVSFLGLLVSYDRPSGPVIVTAFGTVLLIAGLGRYVTLSPRPAAALLRVGAGAGAAALVVVLGLALFGNGEVHDHRECPPYAGAPPSEVAPEEARAAEDLLDTDMLLTALEAAEDDEERLRYAAALARRGEAAGTAELRRLAREGKEGLRKLAAQALGSTSD